LAVPARPSPSRSEFRQEAIGHAANAIAALPAASMFLLVVNKTRQAQTFFATIEHDHWGMNTLAIISILALLTISGAAYTDQLLTSGHHATQRVN
jgi:hypothetical protein